MAKASMSPSASEAESVPERFDVVVSEELAVSAIEPAAGAVMTGASLTAVTDVPRLSVLAEIAVAVFRRDQDQHFASGDSRKTLQKKCSRPSFMMNM